PYALRRRRRGDTLHLRLSRAQPQRVPPAVRGIAAHAADPDRRRTRGGAAARALSCGRARVLRVAAGRRIDARQTGRALVRGSAATLYRKPSAERQWLARGRTRYARRARAGPAPCRAGEAVDGGGTRARGGAVALRARRALYRPGRGIADAVPDALAPRACRANAALGTRAGCAHRRA